MLALDPIINHAAPFLLVLFRLSGLLLFAPILSSATIPVRIRLLLVFTLALALYPTLPPAAQSPPPTDLFSLAPLIFAETFIGLVIGLLASLPMFAVQLAGLVVGQQTGMALGVVFNPALESDADPLSQLLMLAALSIFVAMGGLELCFLALARSFQHAPIDAWSTHTGALDVTLAVLSAGFEIALRISAPVMAVLLIETIASAFLAKTIPQINILSIGYGVKVVLSFVAIIGSMHVMAGVFSDDAHDTLAAINAFVDSLSGPPPASEGAR